MMPKKCLQLIGMMLFGLLSQGLYASISVEPMVLDTLRSAQSQVMRQDLKVYNLDKVNKAYVEVTPQLMTHPGTQQETEVSISDPKKLGIFVSPKKLVIPAGGFRLVRIGFIHKPGNTDRVYRISVRPKVSLAAETTAEFSSGVKILIAYGVLVIQRPNKPEAKLVMQRKDKQLLIKNVGNTNVELIDAKQCRTKSHCVELHQSRRLYAGNQWRLSLPKALPVQFTRIMGNNYKLVESK